METEKIVFLSGNKTNLRPLCKNDVPTITRWANDPEVREYVSFALPPTLKREEEWVENMGKDTNNVNLGIETKDGIFIGLMGLHDINWVFRVATTGAMIGEKDYWGGGYGSDAKMALLDYAFNTLNLNRVNSSAFAFNERSVNYSLKCGYVVEGRKRKFAWKRGQYWDLVDLGVLREEWLPLWEKYKETGSLK